MTPNVLLLALTAAVVAFTTGLWLGRKTRPISSVGLSHEYTSQAIFIRAVDDVVEDEQTIRDIFARAHELADKYNLPFEPNYVSEDLDG